MPGGRPPGLRLPGLRTRATIASSALALLISVALALVTWFAVRSDLLSTREDAVVSRAFLNARAVRASLGETDRPAFDDLLGSLPTERGSIALLRLDRSWFSATVGVSPDSLPKPLLDAVEGRTTGRMRFVADGRTWMAVVVDLRGTSGTYVELEPLDDLVETLTALRTALIAAGVFTTVAGAALGYWVGGRVLQPLTRFAAAAESLAGGGLDTRLPHEADTDLERLVVSFNGMADALQTRIEREARFASDVSHELRTPLAALTASAEVLTRRRDELSPRGAQALEILVAQTRRFDRMVSDLLEISRIEGGVADLHLETVDPAALVRRTLAALGLGEVEVRVDAGDGPTTVVTDRRRLERILVNLLENARIHAGGATAVVVSSDPVSTVGGVCLAVEDAGSGIPPGDRARIFERFARGHATAGRPGSGLGLAVAAQQAAVIGAELAVEDAPGGGARFVVHLPVRVDPADSDVDSTVDADVDRPRSAASGLAGGGTTESAVGDERRSTIR